MIDQSQLASLRRPISFQAELAGQPLHLNSTWGLFSPREIDDGTRLLIEHMEVAPEADCLDLGCGYGPIGLTLARLAPKGRVLMVDKDFVAVEFARKNIARNGLHNAEALLSNGFDQIEPKRRFDLIASNIPAKVGKELLTLWLYDALARLNSGGALYVVTINGLRQFIKRYLEDIFGNYDKLKQGAHYTVALAYRR
ncbi:Ribosomal RNA large subunit methyltransferase G [Thiorhodovibrio winogradskyi]|uniref:Ribosomal RNA large subunit methyltransferase G n=1 Tax=Thiorhodovibrio winogradskyi TaxID=77007 RepID=A0ABZ0SC62_9GAMM|nr:methyltransferase [Thiorhodovibrio winogradskyi]